MFTGFVPKLRYFFHTERTAILIFCFSFILHLVISFFLYIKFGDNVLFFENEDAHSYVNLAKSVAHGEGFSFRGEPSAVRTPFFPLVLAPIYFLGLPATWTVLLLQNALASFSAVLLYRIGAMVFSVRAGLIAAVIYTVEPYLLMTANLATTEIAFNFLLIAFAGFFLRFIKRGNQFRDLIASAVALGLATLTRPIALYVPSIVVLMLVIAMPRVRRLRWFGVHTAIFLGVFGAVLLPWYARQYAVFGTARLTTIDAMMLYYKTAPLVVAENEGLSYGGASRLLAERLRNNFSNFKESDVFNTFRYRSYMLSEAKRLIFSNPWAVVRFYSVSLIPALTGTGYEYMLENIGGLARATKRVSYSDLLLKEGWGALARHIFRPDIFQAALFGGIFLWLMIYVVIAISLFSFASWRAHYMVFIFLFLLIAYFVLFTLGPETHARYRVPTFPFWYLLLGNGIVFIGAALHRIRKPHVV